MTEPDTELRRWINRPARPTAAVLFTAAALLAVSTAIGLIDLFTSPLPPVRYGPFGDPHAFTGAVALTVLFIALGTRAARGPSPRELIVTLSLLGAAGPAGWGLAFLDAIGPDLTNSAGAAGPFIVLFLLVAAPLLTIVGVVAALAEFIRAAVHAPRPTT